MTAKLASGKVPDLGCLRMSDVVSPFTAFHMVYPAYLGTVNVSAFFTLQLDISFYHAFLILHVIDSQRYGDMGISTRWVAVNSSVFKIK